jgi:hypothetical protein
VCVCVCVCVRVCSTLHAPQSSNLDQVKALVNNMTLRYGGSQARTHIHMVQVFLTLASPANTHAHAHKRPHARTHAHPHARTHAPSASRYGGTDFGSPLAMCYNQLEQYGFKDPTGTVTPMR